MVPGEENQLVPKEVRGQRRRLGPRPASARGSAGQGEGSAAGPARVRARLWGKEEVYGGGCTVGAASSWETRLDLGAAGSRDLPSRVCRVGRIKERTGRNQVQLWGRRRPFKYLLSMLSQDNFKEKILLTVVDGHDRVTVLLLVLTVAVCSFQGL